MGYFVQLRADSYWTDTIFNGPHAGLHLYSLFIKSQLASQLAVGPHVVQFGYVSFLAVVRFETCAVHRRGLKLRRRAGQMLVLLFPGQLRGQDYWCYMTVQGYFAQKKLPPRNTPVRSWADGVSRTRERSGQIYFVRPLGPVGSSSSRHRRTPEIVL